jgi:L1 cell adhesion molecule like protein
LGGGTFDVTLLTIDDGIFQVASTSGDTHLGGEDFDIRLLEHVAEDIKAKHEIDVLKNTKTRAKLKKACEQAKRTLSNTKRAEIELELAGGEIDYVYQITRAKFESLNSDLFTKCLQPVSLVLEDGYLSPQDVDDVVLVGGSTRIPKIRELLSNYFGGKDLCTSINPDEAVAYGAAVQGAILAGTENDQIDDIILVDVAPLSVGIETTGNSMSTIIRRNRSIPVRETKRFSTEKDNQKSVTISVYEGERARANQNHLLGEFELTDIPLMQRGGPQIIVTFDIDANGILSVTAEEQSTGNKNEIVISNESGRLTAEEIQAMIKDSEANEHSDNEYRMKIEAKNKLENYVYGFKNALPSMKIPPSEKDELNEELDEIIEWVTSLNVTGIEEVSRDAIKEKMLYLEELSEPYLDLGEEETEVTTEQIQDDNDVLEMDRSEFVANVPKDQVIVREEAEETSKTGEKQV